MATQRWAPDAVTILLLLALTVIVASVIAAVLGVQAVHPGTGETVVAQSLLSDENLRRLFADMPRTFAHFHPLGMVVVVMLGAGFAEKVGLFEAALARAMRGVPPRLLVPATVLIGICAHVGVDAAYFVYVPLAGLAFRAAGRDPFVGVCAAFAGVSGGYGANLLITPTDAVLYGLTEVAARTIDPSASVDLLANYYVLGAFAIIVTALVTFVTRAWLEPRFGKATDAAPPLAREPVAERALRRALVAMALVLGGALLLALPEGAPLRDPVDGLKPFYNALVAILFLTFLTGGLVFGVATGRIRNDSDALRLVREGLGEVLPFIVLAFVAAHFSAFLDWSNLARIVAIEGAAGLRAAGLGGAPLVVAFVLVTASLNLVMPSASAKWAILAPTAVPMLMGAGLSPELITAAYRIGDSATNIVTPTSLLPVVLLYAQRYRPEVGLGGFIRLMIPFAALLLLGGVLLLALWVGLELPLGPTGASHAWPAVAPAGLER